MTLAIVRVTNGAVIDASGTQYVVAAVGTDLIATYVQQAIAAGQTAQDVLDAILAEGLSEGVFASEAAGLSGTTDGQYFWVGSGGTVTLYLNDTGTGDEIAELATAAGLAGKVDTAALASPTGADMVGWSPSVPNPRARTVAEKLGDIVNILDFDGIVLDGVTDITVPLQGALDYCRDEGKTLIGAPGSAVISDTIVVECNCDLVETTLLVDATVVAVAVRVGPAAASEYLFDADIALPFLTNTAKTTSGWSGFNTAIGVNLANVYQSRILVPSVYNFGIGLKCGGYGVGNVYNTITIGVLFGNKINLQLKPGDSAGWSNQNVYIGGRFAHSSGEGVAVSGCKHIEMRADVPIGTPNNNLFINPSLEGNETEFHVDIDGTFNTLINPRLENSGPVRFNLHSTTAQGTTGNLVIGGYIYGITWTFSGDGSSVHNNVWGAKASNTIDGASSIVNLRNTSGAGSPHLQGFEAGVQPLGKDHTATDWVYRLSSDGISFKGAGDANPRVEMNSAGYLFFGPGNAVLQGGLRYLAAGGITTNLNFSPDANFGSSLGTASRVWSGVHTNEVRLSDGITAPSATSGQAKIFVDAADGDLKIIFGDGTVKTIVVDS